MPRLRLLTVDKKRVVWFRPKDGFRLEKVTYGTGFTVREQYKAGVLKIVDSEMFDTTERFLTYLEKSSRMIGRIVGVELVWEYSDLVTFFDYST